MNFKELLRRVAGHSANQIAIQAIGFLAGLLIVRSLDKTEYAQYSLAIALVAALTQLTDSGISAVLLSKGAERLNDKFALTALFQAGNRFRLGYGAVCIAAGSVWLFWLLRLNDTPIPQALTYVGITAAGMFPVLAMGVSLVLFRLKLDLKTIQRAGLYTSILRLVAVLVATSFGVSSPATYLAVTAAVSFVYAAALSARARGVLSARAGTRVVVPDFARAVRATLPSVLVLIAAEQLLLTLLSVRGTPAVIAELNAMSRFGVAFALINAIVNDIAVPIVARTEAVRTRVLRRTAGVVGLYALLCAALVGLTAITAPFLTSLLGPQYNGLEAALVGTAVAFGATNVAVIIGLMNNARGWTRYSWTYIPLIGAWFTATAVFADLTSIGSVVLVVILQAVPALTSQAIRFFVGLRSIPPGRR